MLLDSVGERAPGCYRSARAKRAPLPSLPPAWELGRVNAQGRRRGLSRETQTPGPAAFNFAGSQRAGRPALLGLDLILPRDPLALTPCRRRPGVCSPGDRAGQRVARSL